MATYATRARRPLPWRLAIPVLALVLALIRLMLVPAPASAHAAFESSVPAPGEVLAQAPNEIQARFTEPLERSYSRLELYDSLGERIEGTTLGEGTDEYTMTLAVPAGLPTGTYSVLWRTLSTADGHSAQNYFAFTIGTNADIAAVVIPGSAVDGNEAPQWAQTFSRWAALVGVALLIAAWPVWSTVVRPAIGDAWRRGPSLARRMRRFVHIAIGLAIAGSVVALVVQAMTLRDGSLPERVLSTLADTRYGTLWLVRIGLIAILGALLFALGWWYMRRREVEGVLAWLIAAGVVLPFSLIAHASAQTSGRTVAIAADAIHLFASALWIGGLAILGAVVFPWTQTLDPDLRRRVLARLLPRFSVLGLICVAVLGLTGLYAGWLHVGNLEALRSTAYGQALIVKLVLLVGVLALAGINLLVIERKIRARLAAGETNLWSRRLRWTVGGETLLVVLILVAVGQLTSQQPARDVAIEEARQIAIPFAGEGGADDLLIAPGIAGVNHFRLEVAGPNLPAETDAVLRMTIPDRPDLGTKEIQLARVSGNAFEHHGSELSLAGAWEFTAIIRPPGAGQIGEVAEMTIGSSDRDVDLPGAPWRFSTTGGVTGLVLVLAGVAGGIVALRSADSRMRKEAGGLGVAAAVLGIVLLGQARLDPVLADASGGSGIDPQNVAMVERGESVYATYCLSCHGADLRGNGPEAAGLNPPPADFSEPHTMIHTDEDLVYWLRFGKQGTAMPAFGDVLSDSDMQAVLSYIEYGQGPFAETTSIGACPAATRTLDELRVLVSDPAARTAPNPIATAADPTVDAPTAEAIAAATEGLIACTNAQDTLGRLGLFTDANLRMSFPGGLTPEFELSATQTPVPLPAEEQIQLVGIGDVTRLADGRVMATVTVTDPGDHLHAGGGAAGTGEPLAAVIVFAAQGDRWLIDEIRGP